MHIGMRTVKTAVGTAAAMLIAYELHLEYWTAAGIITILSVQNTTKASFRLVAYRLLATVLGFVIAIGAFLVLGYNALAFGLFLLIFIPPYVNDDVNDIRIVLLNKCNPLLLLRKIFSSLIFFLVDLYHRSLKHDLQ